MKKTLLSVLVISALVLSVLPGVLAVSVGSGMGVSIITEEFEPIVWQCYDRVVYDDATEPGRITGPGQVMVERINNYAFEGEQIQWTVLVMDKNGIDKVKDVYVTVGGDIEANCKREVGNIFPVHYSTYDVEVLGKPKPKPGEIPESCNARILEEKLTTFNPEVMAYYTCTLTVETFESMYGEYEITVEAEDLNGLTSEMAEMEYWFLNPIIELSIDGEISFDEVRPGTSSYSRRVLVGNEADLGSGVLLDMFISGTDFYDSSSSGAKCGTSNVLKLENFRYYATNGAYSTKQDLQVGRNKDAEGYLSINYGTGFNDPNPFYDRHEILQSTMKQGPYYLGNILAPGAEMSLIFRLNLPEPCNGNFDSGKIYFWGEAI